MLDPAPVNHILKKYLAHEALVLSDLSTHFDIHLKNRKGWQQKVDKGQTESDLRSNHYKIYPQLDLPGSDTFFWLLVWMKWLEVFHYDCLLKPDDWIFPAMGANGVVQPREPLPQHCGAQYCFMFAPIGQHWPLAKVCWWGGWGEQEHRNTLIQYLLDELHTYKTNYSDALAPVSRGVNESLELRSVHTSITTNVRGLKTDINNISGVICELTRVIHKLSSVSKHTSAPQPTLLTIHIPPCTATPSIMLRGSLPLLPSSNHASASISTMTARSCQHTAATLLSTTNIGHQANGIPGGKASCSLLSHSTPRPGLLIPDVPVLLSDGTRRPKNESWRDIIKYWLTGDPKLGLHTPLKDWPPKWIQGNNQLFVMKYFEQSIITLEFINTYESDEARFLTTYPQAERGHMALLNVINAAQRECGERPS
ncbi:hypothetical protein BDN67DRAFT_975463 [Paxillus ammoniavirescens]|nr:hypothetical protein BDN67DRAFT_975463 [Paxillus ammoniavirescens]